MRVNLVTSVSRNVLVMGLTLEACVNETCALKMPIFNNSEIPGNYCNPS